MECRPEWEAGGTEEARENRLGLENGMEKGTSVMSWGEGERGLEGGGTSEGGVVDGFAEEATIDDTIGGIEGCSGCVLSIRSEVLSVVGREDWGGGSDHTGSIASEGSGTSGDGSTEEAAIDDTISGVKGEGAVCTTDHSDLADTNNVGGDNS